MTATDSAAARAAVLTQYEALAILARTAAASETLENVRQKHLTSALTWDHLAASARKMEQLRLRRMVEQLSAIAQVNALAGKPIGLARLDYVGESAALPATGKRTLK